MQLFHSPPEKKIPQNSVMREFCFKNCLLFPLFYTIRKLKIEFTGSLSFDKDPELSVFTYLRIG